MDISKYKIKVNKKSFANSQSNIKLYIKKSNRSEEITPTNNRKNYSKSKSRRNESSSKSNSVSNSTQRIQKKTAKIKSKENNEDSILDSLENSNKYLRPILNSKRINENLCECGIKESMKKSLIILLHDFFKREKNHLKTPYNINYNNRNKINCTEEDCYATNNYKTIENSNANSFYNEFTINPPKFYSNNSLEKMKLNFNRKKNKNKVHSSEILIYNNYNKRTRNNTMTEKDLYNKIDNSFEKKSKYNYNKEKFYVYREKLIKVFSGHLKNIFNSCISQYFLLFKEKIKKKKIDQKIKPLNKTIINYQNIQTYKNNANNLNILYKHKRNSIRFFWAANNDNSKTKLQKYMQRNKKCLNFDANNIDTNKYLFKGKKANYSFSNDVRSFHNNISKYTYNSSFMLHNSRNSSNKSKNKLQSNKKTSNKTILRNIKDRINKVNESSNFVYKRKLYINKSKISKKHSPENKIIDININIGKPIGVIRDLNPLDCHYLSQNNHSKHSKISLSSKKKKSKKTPIKHIILPNKKFLEEEENFDMKLYSSFHSMKTFNGSLKNTTNNRNNIIKDNYNINKISKINSKDSKIRSVLVKNIVTSDKLLFIHIKYIYCCFGSENKGKKTIGPKTLSISNNTITIINKKLFEKRHKKSALMNSSFLYKKISRNNIITIGKLNDSKIKNYFKTARNSVVNNKYLNSCLKFLIKVINRLFLFKNYKILKSNIYKKYIPKSDVRIKYRK